MLIIFFYLIVPVAAQYAVIDVFSKGSNIRVSKKWLEAGQIYSDDLNWVSVISVSPFTIPVILLSLPDFGGNTYTTGAPLSLRIRNKEVSVKGTVSFQLKVITCFA